MAAALKSRLPGLKERVMGSRCYRSRGRRWYPICKIGR